MHKYRLVAKKGEGTFSEVLKAQCIKNSKYVAIKCMKNHFDSLDQVNNLREIQALRRLSPFSHVITLLEVLYDQPTGRLALVFELMDMNIYELIRGRRHYLAEDFVRNYMYQLMKSMDHMHRNGIFHRDIKPENILIMDDHLKLADFGSCRGIYSKQPYTEYISTRWYRAPECLLTDGYYSYKMDMWGVGCVFFEIVALFPLFPGANEVDQIQKIHNVLGTPSQELLAKFTKRSAQVDFNFPHKEGTGIAKLIPHCANDCANLIEKLLAYDPEERISARQALKHPYFKELHERERWEQRMQQQGEDAPRESAHPSVAGSDATLKSHGSGVVPSLPTGRRLALPASPKHAAVGGAKVGQSEGLPALGARTGGETVAEGGRAPVGRQADDHRLPLPSVASLGSSSVVSHTHAHLGKSKGQVAAAYSQRHAYKSKKAPGQTSGVRRSGQALSSTKSLAVGPAGSLRGKYGYDGSKYPYSKSKYRNG